MHLDVAHRVDAPLCALLHMWQHLCSNGAEGVFHSSAQLFIDGVVMCSHSSLDTAHKELSEVVRSGLCVGHVQIELNRIYYGFEPTRTQCTWACYKQAHCVPLFSDSSLYSLNKGQDWSWINFTK